MKVIEVCLTTDHLKPMIDFYKKVFSVEVDDSPVFVAFRIEDVSFSLYIKRAARIDMNYDFSQFDGTGNTTIAFAVDDLEMEYKRIQSLNISTITEPRMLPWGARSFQFRDPDGNIISFVSK